MTDVHAALMALSPTEHSEFPSDASSLNLHLAGSLADAHVLISSLPPPAVLPDSLTLPEPPSVGVEALQKEWKPVKLSTKDNPLGISVFKPGAKDGKGTWFARRSIHTDIPFRRFKAGLQQEFQQPDQNVDDSVRAGPVRGIGKDTLIHHETCELGKAEIFHLSAQFPGPSAPRDFVEGCLSSSAHLEDISFAAEERGRSSPNPGDETKGSVKDRPKQFTLISKPVLNHPQGDERAGYVRGTYESVEFIREIPTLPHGLTRSQSTPDVPSAEAAASGNRPRGKTVGVTPEEAARVAGNCAVDWIMITRSDPGGSVPKWMVERGTPGGVVKDAERFLKWCRQATFLDDMPESSMEAITKETEQGEQVSRSDDVKKHTQRHLAERGALAGAVLTSDEAKAELSHARKPSDSPSKGNNEAASSGLFAGALGSVAAGMTSLAQSAMYRASNNLTPPPTSPSETGTPSPTISRSTSPETALDSDASSEAASIRTFATADDSYNATIAGGTTSRPASVASTLTAGSASIPVHESSEERALRVFLREKQKLDDKLKKEDSRRTEREKKIMEKHLRNLEKQERKYRRALEKANERRRKDEEKRERELHKKLEREEKGARKEIDELKKVVEGLTRENLALRERIEELEGNKKNTIEREGVIVKAEA